MNLRSIFRLVVAIAVLLIGSVPAGAAPPVVQISQAPVTSHYDEAARELGFPEWGEITRSDAAVHLTIRLGLRDFRMGFCIPPSVPPKQAEIWLQELSDAMGWTDVELTSSRQPYGTLLTATIHKTTRPAGLGQQQVRIDLSRVRTVLARLTTLPLQIAVRTPAQELVPSNPAAAQGTWKRMRYVFFRDPGRTAKPLTLTYGMGRRWQVALVCAWLAWALFPSLVFYAVRERLRKDMSRTPQERWQSYQRWLRPVWLATVVGTVATPFLLSLQGVALLLPIFSGSPMAFFYVILLVPTSWVVMPACFIGLPLSRAVSEKLQRQKLASVIAPQVLLLVLVHAFLPLILWIQTRPPGKPTDPLSWWIKWPLALLVSSPLLIGGSAWLLERRRWSIRSHSLPSGEMEAAPELTAQVRQLTARLGVPVQRVLLVAKGEDERRQGAAVKGNIATVHRELAERLTPDQVAALVVAERLAEARGWKEWLPGAVGVALGFLGFGSICWMVLSSTTNSFQPSTLQIAMVLGMPVGVIPLQIDTARGRVRRDRADLAAAESLADPQLFLHALQAIEAHRMEASNLDPALVTVPARFTERRRRLERKLGVE